MAVLPIFCQKWDIIVHNARTITRKNLVTNGMNVTTIQLSFDTILMSPSLTNMLVFQMLYDNFPPGVPLMSGFKSRCRQRFGWVNRAPRDAVRLHTHNIIWLRNKTVLASGPRRGPSHSLYFPAQNTVYGHQNYNTLLPATEIMLVSHIHTYKQITVTSGVF